MANAGSMYANLLTMKTGRSIFLKENCPWKTFKMNRIFNGWPTKNARISIQKVPPPFYTADTEHRTWLERKLTECWNAGLR